MAASEKTVAEICHMIGMQFHVQQDYVNAEKWYRHAIDEFPTHIGANEGLMYALVMQRRFQEAIPFCTGAMSNTDPMKRDIAVYNRGLCSLMIGDYKRGFRDYDTRMRMGKTVDLLRKKIGEREEWNGEKCNRLLVYGEQGMGDLFMFCRLIRALADEKDKYCRKLLFEVPPDMESFMRHNFLGVEVIAQSETVTPSSQHVLLVSLAKILEIEVDSVPCSSVSYLSAEPEYIQKWEQFGKLPGLKIGLCWAGRSVADQDLQVAEWNSRRSIKLKELEPLFGLDGVTFVSLQKGIDTDQLQDYAFIHKPELESWSDTAGVMHHLDLVISIDSGPAHLAGALGKETWLLNHVHTCWRWGLVGDRSPWYGSVRVFRQIQEGNWEYPVRAVTSILRQYMNRAA